jgi:hypothetical protein
MNSVRLGVELILKRCQSGFASLIAISGAKVIVLK